MMKKKLAIVGLMGFMGLYAACKKPSPVYVATPPTITLFDILKVSPSFSLFREAVIRTGMDSVLGQPGPFTLLLPDNNAFAHIGILTNGQIDSLDTTYLRQLVQYHIIPQSVASADVPQALQTPYRNLLGDTLYFSQPIQGSFNYNPTGLNNLDQIHVNGDTLLSLDTKADNGYIDVLSSPLKLPVASVQAFLAADTNYTIFVAALKEFGLYDQLAGPGPFTILAPQNSAFGSWKITLDSISHLDTLHFKKYLFGVCIISPNRTFYTDFIDGPLRISAAINNNLAQWYGNGSFFSTDGILTFLYGQGGAFCVLDPVLYAAGYDLLGPGVSPSSPAQVIDFDHIARNGVVQGLNNILIYPDSVQIQ